MSLLEVVGITSTGLTFSVAFCLLAAEKENNFLWALDRLKGLFFRVDSYPRVVVCDRDIALMNAIRIVFLEAYNLLCRFHIDKNVKTKCKMLVHPREAWDQVMEVWGSIVDCGIVEAFEDRVNALEAVCSPWPIFVDYVMTTWCGSSLTSTHGLPCACQLALFGVGSIPLKSVHVMWTRLSFEDIATEQCSSELSIDKEFEVIVKRFKELDVAGILPEVVPPKSIPFLYQFPVGYHPYILDVVDVKADGHCGHCVVAAELGMGEESWAIVRMNLLKQLSEWRQEYVELFGADERYEYLKKSLLIDHMSMAETDKWMTIPDMGYAIANRYNVILVSLSMVQSLSIFPLRTQPPTNFRHHRIIAIGHVHGNHFVQVKLKDGCQIPPTDILWASHCKFIHN
ncbi:uncharacterized protein [Phaseolus vulgaris]|uniref:uncharacterized protein n=1 Tax=Phaseolus vulgaris TaxID=3885 RepID=UPI0035CC8D02